MSVSGQSSRTNFLWKGAWAFQGALVVKKLSANAGDIRDVGSTPKSGRSPGERNCNALQFSCLENPMDRGVWWTAVHGVSEPDTTEATEHARLHARTRPWAESWPTARTQAVSSPPARGLSHLTGASPRDGSGSDVDRPVTGGKGLPFTW